MKLFQATSWLDLIKHLCFILVIGIILVLFFFYVYLPVSTNHGETLTVPDVRGVVIDDLDEFLNEKSFQILSELQLAFIICHWRPLRDAATHPFC